MSDFFTVITTAGSIDEANKIATELVSRKLAACVQSMPITSCYSWEGKINNDPEILLLIKTTSDRFTQVKEAIEGLHSYTTPEIIALPIVDGSKAYLSWIVDCVK